MPILRKDIEYWLQKMFVLDGDNNYQHDEGDDAQRAVIFIRYLLTDTESNYSSDKWMSHLGICKAYFLYEHRTSRFERKLIITIQGLEY